MNNKKINLYTYPVQFSIEEADYSQTYLAQMYPLVEASGGLEEYYIRLSWLWIMGDSSGQADIQSDQPPNWGI